MTDLTYTWSHYLAQEMRTEERIQAHWQGPLAVIRYTLEGYDRPRVQISNNSQRTVTA